MQDEPHGLLRHGAQCSFMRMDSTNGLECGNFCAVPLHAFHHVRKRALVRETPPEDSERLNQRIALARQRRQVLLNQHRLRPPSGTRLQNRQAASAEKSEWTSLKLDEKLERASLKRQLALERRRHPPGHSFEKLHAKEKALHTAHEMRLHLTAFCSAGLSSLPGEDTGSSESHHFLHLSPPRVERILQTDPFLPCRACNTQAPQGVKCPSHRPHQRSLMEVSRLFLETVASWIKQRSSSQGADDSADTSTSEAGGVTQTSTEDDTTPTKPTRTTVPILLAVLPQLLPMAFHAAAQFRSTLVAGTPCPGPSLEWQVLESGARVVNALFGLHCAINEMSLTRTKCKAFHCAVTAFANAWTRYLAAHDAHNKELHNSMFENLVARYQHLRGALREVQSNSARTLLAEQKKCDLVEAIQAQLLHMQRYLICVDGVRGEMFIASLQ